MDAIDQLRDELEGFGIALLNEQLELLLRHLELVIEKNKVLNLTRIDSIEEGITRHIVDSLLLLPSFNETQGRFFDLGTGAGFPGIPLAIASERSGLLNDSVGKKVVAVEEFAAELGLAERVETSSERAEVLGKTLASSFGCVTARAVAKLPTLVEYASPLLSQGGRLIATKGNVTTEELASGKVAANLCGMRQVASQSFDLPHDAGHREIIVYEKVSKPRIKLPRAVGKAKSSPLA